MSGKQEAHVRPSIGTFGTSTSGLRGAPALAHIYSGRGPKSRLVRRGERHGERQENPSAL